MIFHDCETRFGGEDYDTANESLSSDSQEELNGSESENESDCVESDDEANSEENESENNCSDDDDSWITPQNMSDLKRSAGCSFAESTSVTVGCLTTDFAIQVKIVNYDSLVLFCIDTFTCIFLECLDADGFERDHC